MPWYVLLIIALASLAVVIGALAYVGVKAWRLVKHGAAVSRRVTPLVDGLAHRADEAAAAAERLSADGEQLGANLQRMQRSVARLQVIAQTFNDALRPYYLIAGWLSGEKEWSDLGI
jgi:uncharacterized protein YoxC